MDDDYNINDQLCENCGCPCHCYFEKHSTWGGPPSASSGECDCPACECGEAKEEVA